MVWPNQQSPLITSPTNKIRNECNVLHLQHQSLEKKQIRLDLNLKELQKQIEGTTLILLQPPRVEHFPTEIPFFMFVK